MSTNRTTEICAQDATGAIECDLIALEDRLPVIWPIPPDTSFSPKTNGLTAVETRAQDPIFVAQCSLTGLQDRLPLI